MSAVYLLVNSCTSQPFVGLVRQGALSCFKKARQQRSFAQEGMPLVRAVLAESQIGLDRVNGFGFITGPGSFTGIRIGLSMLKGMAFGGGGRAAALTSLALYARPYFGRQKCVCPVLDARLGRFYCAVYGESGRCEVPPAAVTPEALHSLVSDDVLVVGDDAPKAGIKNPVPFLDHRLPQDMAEAAVQAFESDHTTAVTDLAPLYLRQSYAEISQ